MKLNVLFEHQYKSIVAIVYDNHENILLGKALNKDDRFGKWCFPAGGVKPGECPGETAKRECFEETNLKVMPMQFAFPHKSSPNIGYVVCRMIDGQMKPNSEFSELKWVPWNKVLELKGLYPDVGEVLKTSASKLP